MAQILNEVPKALASLGASIGSSWKVIRDVQGHFALRKEIRNKNGKEGLFFFFCYTLFQYLYQIGLGIIAVATVVAFVGGVLKVFEVQRSPWHLVAFYDRYTIKLVIFAVVLTGWSFCTKASERVYITAMDCETGLGGTRGLWAAGAGGL